MSKSYAVRIVVHHADGSSSVQNHVNPANSRISRENFVSMSLGRMLRMLSDWQDYRGLSVTGWTIDEIDPESA
jgi:hypothetical protein